MVIGKNDQLFRPVALLVFSKYFFLTISFIFFTPLKIKGWVNIYAFFSTLFILSKLLCRIQVFPIWGSNIIEIEWIAFFFQQVELLIGKDKGKQGTIIDIIRERNWVVVEGLNCVSLINSKHFQILGYIAHCPVEPPLPPPLFFFFFLWPSCNAGPLKFLFSEEEPPFGTPEGKITLSESVGCCKKYIFSF